MVNATQIITEIRPSEWWKEPPEEIARLSPHIANKLIKAGITTVQQVRDAGPVKLLKIDGLGKVALEEIKFWLRSFDGEAD